MTPKEVWLKGIEGEINFWDNWLETKGGEWPEEYLFRINPQSVFQEHLITYLPEQLDLIDILDVGSGPLSFLGKTLPTENEIVRKLRITGTDPLMDAYMTLLKRHNVQSSTCMVKANSEDLSRHFPADYFEFVYMRNALDHAFDPLLAVGEMIRVVKPGHYIILEHKNNEAENENYHDLHQWNIKIEQGAFIIWNKSIMYNVTEYYKEEAQIICHANDNPTHFTEKSNFIEIRKK
jgi:ubiquinone/menaquinone biosynthesis C-methylase UbiE